MNYNKWVISVQGLILGSLSVTALAANLPTIAKTGFTTKVIQLDGPCDWASWDPKTPPEGGKYAAEGACGVTAAQANPGDPYIATGVMGQGLGYSFEETGADGKPTGKMIVLFGDSIGFDPGNLKPNPATAHFPNFHAKDTLAWSTSNSEADFRINYYSLPVPEQPDAPLFITEPGKEYLPPQPSGEEPSYVAAGTNVSMGPYDIPNSGISLNGQTYLIVNTGRQITGSTSADYSVLVKFDGVSTFTTGRTVSESNYGYTNISCTGSIDGKPCPPPLFMPGHFVFDALTSFSALGPCEPVFHGGCIYLPFEAIGIYGNGQFRASSLYFSYVPASSFESGTDSSGNSTTQYFAGYAKDGTTPKWTSFESEAQPLFWDNPPTFAPPAHGDPDPGTVGNASVSYDKNSKLWLMLYDGGKSGGQATTGIYFTYAAAPWGPWEKPQLIYNACQAHEDNRQGYGDIIFYFTKDIADPNDNGCSSALDGINGGSKRNPITGETAAWSGPAGPVIGTPAPFGPEAFTTRGGEFAPQIIGRFSGSKDGRLIVQYTLSTWNPYTVVLMETDFTITLNGQ